MIKIECLDDDGAVTEVVDVKEHRCSPNSCESPVVCEGCGATGDQVAIFFWATADGMEYFLCRPCIDADDYVRVAERATPVRNPETGKEVYPWMMPDGRPVDSNGYPIEA